MYSFRSRIINNTDWSQIIHALLIAIIVKLYKIFSYHFKEAKSTVYE